MSRKEHFIELMYKASTGIANAVLVTLGIGLLFESIGGYLGWEMFMTIGGAAKMLLAPALGAGIAYQLGGNSLVIFSAMASSTVGGAAIQKTAEGYFTIVTGQPISAVLAGLIATYVGIKLTGKTKLDIMAIPLGAVLIGGVSGVGLAAVTTPLLTWLSAQITASVQGSPVIGSIVIALVWSLLLMTPASSAALAIALQLDPVSSAAALIGCTVQFVGFTVMSRKDNDLGGILAQIVVTPKVQFPNLIKKPIYIIPPFVAAAICAPIATIMFDFQVPYELGGMGLSSLIAPISVATTQGFSVFFIYVAVGMVLPAIITLGLHRVLKMMGKVQVGDLHLKVQ
ncbi:PTS sugar transporter subunit IIC [Bacillus sp. AGMB 02131]|uniref:PTS sugar transporter subunit IIC n=1 Tax=Peribacillus faecalis TaxID=2772559 RepID=A0A927HA36_9BACI|nr:PTS sugar transporter subunit IIC [Peribacillus faecalis]MBD3107137.1 PTS sugar transporter subunit IIC [Peribacillus faecalis]